MSSNQSTRMDLATGALGILPSKLELLQDQYRLRKDVSSRVVGICDELRSMHTALLLKAGEPWDQPDEQIKIWAREIREASYDFEDVIDTLLMHIRDSTPSNPSRLLCDMMSKPFIKAKAIHQIAVAISDIESRIQDLHKRHYRYKFEAVVDRVTIDPRLVAMFKGTTELIGIDQSRDEIISMLMSDDKRILNQISIVGIGGLGKTTLAKVTYDKLKGYYDCAAFVSVGQNPDLVKLFKDIFVQLGMYQKVGKYNKLNEFELIVKIREYLSERRYLIVLDDVWEEKSWESLALAFVKNGLGSGIIITTRKFQVATIAGEVYKLQPLSYHDSKTLFYKLIFDGEGICIDEEIDEVSDKFLEKCDGIPLAIITMASLLVGKPTRTWSELYTTNVFGHKSNSAVEDTMRIFSFSFYDLPSPLRTCFAYLSKFPDDYVIDKSTLIWKWIAEGFIEERQGTRLFELGEVFFNDLVSRNVIQVVQSKFDNTVQGCRIHSMVLGLIRFLSSIENFVSVLDEEGHISRSGKLRRLAIHTRKEEHNLGDNMNLLPWLRSFTAIECPIYMIPPVLSFKMLRVLDLESCGSMEDYELEHLGKLHNLRFMGLSNTFVRKLPQEIGHLKFLQTLELKGSGVEELPAMASMGELAGLMCLNADWTTRVPNWIGMLTSLQQLVMYPCGGNNEYSTKWFVEGLGNLRELRVLRLLIKADDEKQLTQLLKSALKLPKIEALHFDYYGAMLNSRVKLEPSGFACCVRSLELQLLEFSRLPVWLNAHHLPQICHLSLLLFDVDKQDLENLKEFKVLHHLHLLIVNTERRDAITCASGGFENLRFFSITKPFKFLQGVMQRLEILDFHFNVLLQSGADSDSDFDFGLENIPSLQQVNVQINYLDAFPEEVEEVEAALRHAINVHPNRPIIHISLPRQKLDKAKNDGANDISYRDKGKRVEMAKGHSKLAYYSKSLSSAHDGTDKPMDELIKRLYVVDNEAYDKRMKIETIVRSEGLGKTTLAQKVFDKLSPHFDCAAFVLVGRNPDMRKVFTDILIGLDNQKYKDFPMTTLDIMELIRLVRKSVINKRFFVVIDDIWDLKAWDIIKCALIENSNGSAVLTTTSRQNREQQNWWSSGDDGKPDFDADKQLDPRSTTTDHSLHLDAGTPADVPAFSPSKKPRVEVELISHEPDSLAFGTPQVGGTQPEPSLFCEADIKGYFYEKLFGSEDKCPDDLKDICKDLIEISAGILSDAYETVEELRRIPTTLENWQPVYQRRKFVLSYPKLPDYLKNCLRYFSMFPKGYEISAERLVWAWIAQGFIKETQGRQDLHKQEVGKSYLSDLINRKMIEALEVDADGMALSCRAYDLLHGLIVSMSTEEKFVEILNDSQEKALPPDTKVHRLSIQTQRNNIVHSPPKAWLNQVQSLVVSCDAVPSLSDFQGLRAMDLGGCDSLQVGHLKGIRKTTSLAYLAIGGKYIAAIPKEVSWLKNLRTLDLTASGLSEFPRCVLSLTGLERLFVNSHMKIPGKIAKMSGLQELGDINIVKPELLKKLRNLSRLRVLRIAMWSWDEGSKTSVKLWWEALHSLVGSCKNIESLSILTFCSLDFMDGSDDNKWTPQTLRKFEIRHSSFHDKLPSWFNSLSNISLLTIEVNKLSQNITDTLGKLSTLSSLSLTSKQVPEREVHFVIDSADRFKKLESLKFVSDEMVKLLERPESNATQQFTRLTIVFQASRTALSRNKDFRFGFDKLLSLQHVRVEINCSNARQQTVNDAEGAIREEISKIYRNDGSQPNLEIRRLQEESMIAEEDQTTGPQDAKTSSSSTMKTMRAQPIGQSLMPSVEIVSKVLSQNSSDDTFFKNVGILTSSTKIKTLKERALQELTAEKQGSTALHQEVDELKKKSKVTEQALAKIQMEFEEYKKQQEDNNLLLKRILHSNSAVNS
ncbi:disease resistance protein RGA5-like [Miscanthus floridulus]|uniref:disease resistance protein RGA5-like n=1 Tax=Miscanthus floridulus TaxID=154761 RepID=UPI003458E550